MMIRASGSAMPMMVRTTGRERTAAKMRRSFLRRRAWEAEVRRCRGVRHPRRRDRVEIESRWRREFQLMAAAYGGFAW
eukprot:647411-Pleurochrysis_carterae.AAC.1